MTRAVGHYVMDKVIGRARVRHSEVAAPASHRTSIMALAFFALYIALDWLTYVFPARFGITPFNPEAAAAIALLMFCGWRYLPLVFVAVLWGEFILPASTRPLVLLLINSALLTGGFAAIAHLLRSMRIELDTRRDVLRLMGVTLACMLVCGVAYVGVLLWFGVGPEGRYYNGARRFFIGYSMGILVAAPLIFMLSSAKRRTQFADFSRAPEAWLQTAAVLACVGWVFLQDQRDHVRYFYVLFLPLVWVATRFGMVGAASAMALIQAGLLLLVHFSGYQPLSVFELQLLLIALAITGLLLGVAVDQQRRATADLRESLKLAAASELAAAIAHEINQPLTALCGYATAAQLIVAAPTPDRTQLVDTLRKLLDESRRTAAVVRRLRDFFRAGATQLEKISLPALITQVSEALRARALAAQVTVTCGTRAPIPPVLMDAVQIEVVLRNLLLNAIDSAAGSADATVAVEIATTKAGEVLVAVSDSGAGIPESEQERMFESFVTTKTGGMGMGLAISRAILEAHGGRIWAVPGSAGLLCFTLPLDAAASAHPGA